MSDVFNQSRSPPFCAKTESLHATPKLLKRHITITAISANLYAYQEDITAFNLWYFIDAGPKLACRGLHAECSEEHEKRQKEDNRRF